MGLDCWEEDRRNPGTYECNADGPPTLPDYCQIYVTYTCGCEEMYEKECNDWHPMSIRWDDDTLWINDYGDIYADENCGGLVFGDVILLPNGDTLPAEACPNANEPTTDLSLLDDIVPLEDVTIVDDSWRTYQFNAFTIDVEGDCWGSIGTDRWHCNLTEGDCWVTFTHTWTGAKTEFYASCKEHNYMRLWLDKDGDWCIADWDKMKFTLKKDQK